MNAPREPDRKLRAVLIALGVLSASGVAAELWLGVHARRPSPRLPTPSASRAAPPAPVATPSASAPPAPPPVAEVAFPELESDSLAARNQAMISEMQRELSLSDDTVQRLRQIFSASTWIGQGNPKPTEHPMTRAECRERRAQATSLPAGDPRCGAPNMVPLYDPSAGQTAADAKTCIDQYEFPNIPCEYPVVWVRASEAVEICKAEGKRICDAHEWEGACAGALKPVEQEYPFGKNRENMQYFHNLNREMLWSYGAQKDHGKCATMSRKNKKCQNITFEECGSNTYPAGAFPDCRSPLGAFDLNGNAAEHMNFAVLPEQLASRGGLGETEMKGSWFIFSRYEAHPDDCRWRAWSWHVTRIDDPNSHRNYHLGFRCCRDL